MTRGAPSLRQGGGWGSAAILVGALATCFVVAGSGSKTTAPKIGGWYASLDKPAFNPPNRVFPVVWTLLYGMMAVALWRAVEDAPRGRRRRLVLPFAVQLFLNAAWTRVFFGHESPGGGLMVNAALIGAVAWTTAAFARVSRVAGWLMAPYLAWVAFATLLNARIWAMNG